MSSEFEQLVSSQLAVLTAGQAALATQLTTLTASQAALVAEQEELQKALFVSGNGRMSIREQVTLNAQWIRDHKKRGLSLLSARLVFLGSVVAHIANALLTKLWPSSK